MENRKYVKFIVPAILLGFFVPAGNIFAYGIDTHAYLTQEVLDFYNKNFSGQRIPENLKNYLVDGSRREDDTPRWMNHFYDPVNDRGLESVYGNGYKSKEWAQSSDKQNDVKYKVYTAMASILTAIEQQKISALTAETDYTWQGAIRFYVNGDKEKAMFLLGHVLHLIEDASVPEHTRNDPHPGGYDYSPYENFTRKFTLTSSDGNLINRLGGRSPVILDNLGSYFDGLAGYSNNNFYSQDTIGIQSGYGSPVPDYDEKTDGYLYGIKKDGESGDYKLFVRTKLTTLDYAVTNTDNVSLVLNKEGGDLVLQDYWSRLSTKSVQYGAGVINLFFQEVEKAKNDPNFVKTDPTFYGKLIRAATSLGNKISDRTAAVINAFSSFGGWVSSWFWNGSIFVEEINISPDSGGTQDNIGRGGIGQANLETTFAQMSDTASDKTADRTAPAPTNTLANESRNSPKSTTTTAANTAAATTTKKTSSAAATTTAPALTTPQSLPLSNCSFITDKTAAHAGVIINEVAWMGTEMSASNEWIELKNITSHEINLSGSRLIDKGEQIKVDFGSDASISANSFYLLERTSDETVPNVKADAIYSGALSNMDEGLRLFDSECDLIDEALAAPNWSAGDNTSKKTMERDLSGFGWHTASAVGGTPKMGNSQPVVGGSFNNAPATESSTPADLGSADSVGHIVISEFSAGTDGGSDDEFVELYNPTNAVVDLTGWALKKKTSSGTESNLVSASKFTGSIAPKSFFLIAHPNYKGGTVSDLAYSVSSSNLAYTNNAVLVYDASGQVVDEVAYASVEKNKSLERKAYNSTCVSAQGGGEFLGNGCDTDSVSDFETREVPLPQNAQSLPEPRSAPASVKDLNISISSSSMELLFDWTESSDDSGTSTGVTYRVVELAVEPTSTLAASAEIYNGSAACFSKAIAEVGRAYRFSIQAVDKNGLGSEVVEKEIQVPSFLTGLYFYKGPAGTIYDDKPVLELDYKSYPFLPSIYRLGSSAQHHYVIFYLNHDPETDTMLDESHRLLPAKTDNILNTEYVTCGFSLESQSATLVLEDDISDGANCTGGIRHDRLVFSKIGTTSIIVATQTKPAPYNEGDYVTMAFYGRYNPTPGEQFKLIAIDKTHHAYQAEPPRHESPQMDGAINTSFDKTGALLTVNWSQAADVDTKNDLLTYEVNFSTSSEFADGAWQSNGVGTGFTKGVAPDDLWLIGVRAKDEFGGYSNIATTTWAYPTTTFYIEQLEEGSWNGSWGDRNINCSDCYENDIDTASYQSIVPITDFVFNKVIVKVREGGDGRFAILRLGVYEDAEGKPDSTRKIAETTSYGDSFYFDTSVAVTAGVKYWLVLDVSSYPDVGSSGFTHNSFYNAVSVTDNYAAGAYGRGPVKPCRDTYYCPTDIPASGTSPDWYMRIGLEP